MLVYADKHFRATYMRGGVLSFAELAAQLLDLLRMSRYGRAETLREACISASPGDPQVEPSSARRLCSYRRAIACTLALHVGFSLPTASTCR